MPSWRPSAAWLMQTYRWEIGDAPLAEIANVERKMPPEFISPDGFHITDACRTYLQPLIIRGGAAAVSRRFAGLRPLEEYCST
jgi:hypothetical protein